MLLVCGGLVDCKPTRPKLTLYTIELQWLMNCMFAVGEYSEVSHST